MKKINYSRVFTQKLRENGVMGIFCEKASDELLCLLFSKKDTWTEITDKGSTYERVKQIAHELDMNGEDRVMKALEVTDTVWGTIELSF